uniref:Uncharacterized protein n=1 Tax=Anguilla anguilla TaxID=7936 RepID=A0A0E9X2K6_ANGAN
MRNSLCGLIPVHHASKSTERYFSLYFCNASLHEPEADCPATSSEFTASVIVSRIKSLTGLSPVLLSPV